MFNYNDNPEKSNLQPPTTNRGVKSSIFNVDYLTVTARGSWRWLCDGFSDFGVFIRASGGGLGYTSRYEVGEGHVKIYMGSKDKDDSDRFTIQISGQACQVMGFDRLKELYQSMNRHFVGVAVTRIDLAFSECPFSVDDFKTAIYSNNYRSYVRREGKSIREYNSPFQPQETGDKIGCQTFYFGSRASERMVRVYNTHGFTRLELECKAKRAELVAADIFIEDNPVDLALAHLRDYVDILEKPYEKKGENKIAGFWADFLGGVKRAGAKIIQFKKLCLEKMRSYVEKQVSGVMGAIYLLDRAGWRDWSKKMMEVGRLKAYDSPLRASILSPRAAGA